MQTAQNGARDEFSTLRWLDPSHWLARDCMSNSLVRLGVQPEHRLVTSGPYRLVRHPGYLSNLLCLASVGLAVSSLGGLGLSWFVVPLIVQRIAREEEMLIAELGQEYGRYRQRTRWRLIPRVFCLHRRWVHERGLLRLSKTETLEGI